MYFVPAARASVATDSQLPGVAQQRENAAADDRKEKAMNRQWALELTGVGRVR